MARTRAGTPDVGADPGLDNLQKIEHIVVLMLENRSFDHMLGYLSLESERGDVDGLKRGMKNEHAGQTYPIRKLRSTRLDKAHDPCHSPDCVDEQLAGESGGFVKNFVERHPGVPNPGVVMGYYDAAALPVYDHLASDYCVCDRWFCSVGGDTWPNRLYALTGGSDGKRKHFEDPPLYDLKSFVRHLDHMKVTWKWYFHDVPILSGVDPEYRPPKVDFGDLRRITFFDRRYPFLPKTFAEDAASGHLPGVAWIDPNFADVRLGPAGSNDDHPPSDVTAGQDLVLKVYNALLHSPVWEKTMLVVTYDEHGGFFDHVQPPAAEDDFPDCRRYGPRVPALIVSPWVEPGSVSHDVLDHTSIIKTILVRFCRQPDGTIPEMGKRVAAARHLGGVLSLPAARGAAAPEAVQPLVDHIADWRRSLFTERIEQQAQGDVPEPHELSELQGEIVALRQHLANEGVAEAIL